MKNSTLLLFKELRQRLLLWLLFFAMTCVLFLSFANRLFIFFAQPLTHALSGTQHMIATGILSGFWIPIELSVWLALLLSIPFLFFQCWIFLKPALKKHELFWGRFYLCSSILLFFAGLFFCYFIVLPICLNVMMHAAPNLVNVMPDIVNYLSFSFRLLLGFGLTCQIPLLVLLLCQFNITTPTQLKKIRRYVIVCAFVAGMIIAPDVISQCFLAIPFCILFELGIFLALRLSLNGR